jgi:hypothetical protein
MFVLCQQQHLLLTFLAVWFGIVGCLAISDTTTTTMTSVTTTSTTTTATSSAASKSSIPRTMELPGASLNGEHSDRIHFPPWNPSPHIDPNGFLISKYRLIPGEWERDFYGRKQHHHQRRQSPRPPPRRRRPPSTTNKSPISLSRTPPATIRQVPGDGNCLFHSISTCYAYAVNGTHLDLRNPTNLRWLYQQSTRFRQLAVDCLEGRRYHDKDTTNNNNIHHNSARDQLLFLHGQDYLSCRDLVEAAASPYGISGKEYCHLMRQNSYWGGGPEIVALCNVLERPIHVYELHVPQIQSTSTSTTRTTRTMKKSKFLASLFSTKQQQEQQDDKDGAFSSCDATTQRSDDTTTSSFKDENDTADDTDTDTRSFFVLRRMACFGSPKFDKETPLHILSVDSRFPDISPGKQLSSGNHFMAIFPHDNNDVASKKKKKKKKKTRIRGGAGCSKKWEEEYGMEQEGDVEDVEEEYDSDDEPRGWWGRFWSFW